MHGLEGIAGKPVLSRLGLEIFQEQLDLSSTVFRGERYEDVGTAQVSIVFEDLILKNQVIPECVPGKV